MFVALGIQHVMRLRHIVICGLPHSTLFFHFNSKNGKIFEKKVTELKMCVLISSILLSEIFRILR
jgi:hypothetical protein